MEYKRCWIDTITYKQGEDPNADNTREVGSWNTKRALLHRAEIQKPRDQGNPRTSHSRQKLKQRAEKAKRKSMKKNKGNKNQKHARTETLEENTEWHHEPGGRWSGDTGERRLTWRKTEEDETNWWRHEGEQRLQTNTLRAWRGRAGEGRNRKTLEGGKNTQEELKSTTGHTRVKFQNKTGNSRTTRNRIMTWIVWLITQ